MAYKDENGKITIDDVAPERILGKSSGHSLSCKMHCRV